MRERKEYSWEPKKREGIILPVIVTYLDRGVLLMFVYCCQLKRVIVLICSQLRNQVTYILGEIEHKLRMLNEALRKRKKRMCGADTVKL